MRVKLENNDDEYRIDMSPQPSTSNSIDVSAKMHTVEQIADVPKCDGEDETVTVKEGVSTLFPLRLLIFSVRGRIRRVVGQRQPQNQKGHQPPQ